MSLTNTPPKTGGFVPRDRRWQPDALTPGYKTSIKRSPQAALLSFPTTLSEETSPVFGQAILGALDNDLLLNYAKPGESAIGPRIIVHGRVLDEMGRGVPGALVEFWRPMLADGIDTRKKAIRPLLIRTLEAAGARSRPRTDPTNSAPSNPAPTRGRTA